MVRFLLVTILKAIDLLLESLSLSFPRRLNHVSISKIVKPNVPEAWACTKVQQDDYSTGIKKLGPFL